MVVPSFQPAKVNPDLDIPASSAMANSEPAARDSDPLAGVPLPNPWEYVTV